ncbi:hypothetical protein AHAS_Ahas12G0063300 [Arachis hypogaea]
MEVSLLNDAVSQIDEPFLLVIVGEFNSGKSTVINALLGERYLKEGVVPTTNEKEDLAAVNDIVNSVNDFAMDIETESLSWRRQTSCLIETTKSRVVELIEATLLLSNLDIVASYAFKGEKSTMAATSRIQNDILGPAVSATQESFEKRWPSLNHENSEIEKNESLKQVDQAGSQLIDSFSSSAASKSFEQQV